MYSTETGTGAARVGGRSHQEIEDMVDAVVRRVVASWSNTTDAQSRAHLTARRPYIPGDLDRALLMDLSERLGVYDIEDPLRYLLRDRFWEVIDDAGQP